MSDFLGPHGKATVVLMKAHFDSELPKLKDLKKLLHIPDGKYYKSGGRNYHSIQQLEKLLNVLSEIRGEERDWNRYRSSDYLVTVAEVHSNLFMTLKYSAQVVEGFNLTDACLQELEKLMQAYQRICFMRKDVENMWSTLQRNQENAVEEGIQDQTLCAPDIPALQKILHGYGDAQYSNTCTDLQDWYQTYRWKVSATRASNGTSQPEETAEAV